ncbi:hypothetical protein K2173_024715 [Erythroxylum novogranatense]|uniref:Uncharacterized protein n=1 Tax=Erythroxylum novogranatense TaxID=1862640 RepID=A0AAV8SW78_9ROSI|nr:hypothetical protein K2173_024715 [Erythroxylum novogranatense]
MRCKKHPFDHSSAVGVCATCLRDRLFVLVAAQVQAQTQAQAHQDPRAVEASRKSDSRHHPPLIFPRSVSPYVSRRKSDDDFSCLNQSHSQLLFYTTPQVGPGCTSSTTTTAAGVAAGAARASKTKTGKFSLITKLFRPRSDKLNPDPDGNGSSSPLWFSTIFSAGSSKKKPSTNQFSVTSMSLGEPRLRADRGMSPARRDDNDEDCDPYPSSSDSTHPWKRTPTSVRRGKPGHSRNTSGLSFCLSPLVRPSPNHHWTQKATLPPDLGFSGDLRASPKPHLSTAASYCANRSRKLVDFGKVNHNR